MNPYLKDEWLAQRPKIVGVGQPFTGAFGYFGGATVHNVPGGPFAVNPGETLTVRFALGSEQDAKVVIERPEAK